MFLHDNALNTKAFPSLGRDPVRGRRHVPPTCSTATERRAGFMTSGGTESILMAVKAARERGKAERGITEPEMVVAESAHAAFHKAAHYFGVKVNKMPVRRRLARRRRRDGRARQRPNTVLVVGSAPQYPQGVIDPIPELAALAAVGRARASTPTRAWAASCCRSWSSSATTSPPWDFRVDGVTTISADIHKLGYAPKGASVILHRSQGAAALPDVRVRRLARRLLRLAEHAGHAARRCRWRRRGR